MVVFFFKQKTAYEMRISDWSSDVCSSDLTFHCNEVPGISPFRPNTACQTSLSKDDRRLPSVVSALVTMIFPVGVGVIEFRMARRSALPVRKGLFWGTSKGADGFDEPGPVRLKASERR